MINSSYLFSQIVSFRKNATFYANGRACVRMRHQSYSLRNSTYFIITSIVRNILGWKSNMREVPSYRIRARLIVASRETSTHSFVSSRTDAYTAKNVALSKEYEYLYKHARVAHWTNRLLNNTHFSLFYLIKINLIKYKQTGTRVLALAL